MYDSTDDLLKALYHAWSSATSSRWRPDNPALRQCGVTSLIVQDLFGGDIVKTPTPGGMHFYNFITGQRVDLTASQFETRPVYNDLPSSRLEAMSNTNETQYQGLRERLDLPVNEWQAVGQGCD